MAWLGLANIDYRKKPGLEAVSDFKQKGWDRPKNWSRDQFESKTGDEI